jgi:hypothetical protein
MTEIPETVGVGCPRCDTPIVCALKVAEPLQKPKPGMPKPIPGGKTAPIALTVPDLAERFAEHYRDAHPGVFTEAIGNVRTFSDVLADAMERVPRDPRKRPALPNAAR